LAEAVVRVAKERDEWKGLAEKSFNWIGQDHFTLCDVHFKGSNPCTCGLTQLREQFERMGK